LTPSTGWPVTLTDGEITLRPLRRRDRKAWQEVRDRNRSWLSKWEAGAPPESSREQIPSFGALVRFFDDQARSGTSAPLIIWCDGVLVGQVTLGGITYGALRSAYIGYWIDERYAGRGIVPRAVDLLVGYAFMHLKLHRIEINFRPENEPSRRVAEKCGFSYEGERKSFLFIDHGWRDHLCYVLIE
jgi:ribosomal-protein-alanine N-acetyltransferase